MRKVAKDLDLSVFHDHLVNLAETAFLRGDAVGFLCRAPNDSGLAIVDANVGPLVSRGIYEEALVHAYSACRLNWRSWGTDELRQLFDLGNRERLRAAGEPVPAGSLRLYRGVAGPAPSRKPEGLSWTLSLEGASWFATRFKLRDPAVHTAEVPSEQVYCCIGDRNEDDFVVYVAEPELMALDAYDLCELADEHERRRGGDIENSRSRGSSGPR